MKKILYILLLLFLVTGCSKKVDKYIDNSLIKNNESYNININISGNYDKKIINDEFDMSISNNNKMLSIKSGTYFIVDKNKEYCLKDQNDIYSGKYTKCTNKTDDLINKSDDFIEALKNYKSSKKTDYGYLLKLNNIDNLLKDTILKSYNFNNIEAEVYINENHIERIKYILVDNDKEYLKINVYINSINEKIDITIPEIKKEKTL